MANTLQLNTSTVFAGLGTSTFTVTTAGLYTVQFEAFLPYLAAGTSNNTSTVPANASALQVVVNLNGVAKLTTGGATNNPSPTQPTLGGRISLQCVATDVITVVLSSASAGDAQPNAVKTILNLFQGE